MVTEDGFPVFGEVLDGNLDDKTCNKQLIKNLPAYFNLEELKRIIYVADSALVTQDNLQAIGDDLQFISHLSENFNLASELTRAAFVKNKWLELGKRSKYAFKEAKGYSGKSGPEIHEADLKSKEF